jgi:putative superfamily III holin-X
VGMGERPGLGGAAKLVADRARSIVRLEIQLALAEVKHKLVALGLGIGLLAVGTLFVLLALTFAVAAAAAALATALSVWLALLVVGGCLLLLAGALGVAGVMLLRRGSPPVPEQALEEARLTAEALRNGGS